MSDHTPGPWVITGDFIDGPRGSNSSGNDSWNSVAQVFGPDWEANARLIVRSWSMLALLEKAYPIIEEEAERRSFSYHPEKDDDNPYWTEMAELRDAISAEIDLAGGKEVKSDVD